LTLLALTTLAQRSDSLLICSPQALGRAADQAQPGLLQALLDARVLNRRVECGVSFAIAASDVPAAP